MKSISKEMFEKYSVATLENEKQTEMGMYLDFLSQTDYLAMKLAEGLITRDDKKAEFDARDFARQEINRLQTETK